MPSTKLENRILLCLVAFGVSGGIGLIANRDIVKALTTGAIATVASFVGGTVVDRKTLKQERLIKHSFKHKAQVLKNEIEQLEDYKEQLRQSLMTTTTVQEEIDLSIHNLSHKKIICSIASVKFRRKTSNTTRINPHDRAKTGIGKSLRQLRS
ncbi:MAG: hypothetical protein HC784_07605 [Hydrococcus sp. CSU_1_8]|nr:hypothetical protein [Hydrococcus sp. CSU_1_8]